MKLSRVTLTVIDRDKQLAFYRDLLGFPVKGRDDDPTFIELDAGPVSIALVTGGRMEDRQYAPKMTFYVDDVADMLEELTLLGVRMSKLKSFGDLHSADGLDPEGNPFQISNRP